MDNTEINGMCRQHAIEYILLLLKIYFSVVKNHFIPDPVYYASEINKPKEDGERAKNQSQKFRNY